MRPLIPRAARHPGARPLPLRSAHIENTYRAEVEQPRSVGASGWPVRKGFPGTAAYPLANFSSSEWRPALELFVPEQLQFVRETRIGEGVDLAQVAALPFVEPACGYIDVLGFDHKATASALPGPILRGGE